MACDGQMPAGEGDGRRWRSAGGGGASRSQAQAGRGECASREGPAEGRLKKDPPPFLLVASNAWCAREELEGYGMAVSSPPPGWLRFGAVLGVVDWFLGGGVWVVAAVRAIWEGRCLRGGGGVGRKRLCARA